MARGQNFDWNHMRAFLATVEAGTLSGAARTLGLTQPTLSRQIAALEAELGLLLFERVGKRLNLTEAGTHLAGVAREMGSVSERISLAVSGQSSAVDGLVRLTAIDVFAAYVLPPIVKCINGLAPGIVFEIKASNTIEDLLRREADIAIRHVEPTQPDLIARRCPDSEIRLFAATQLLESYGNPTEPADLAKLPFVGFPDNEILVRELNNRGFPLRSEAIRWRCASSLINWMLIGQGFGIGIMFPEAVNDAPGVQPILPAMEPLRAPLWLVTHRELHTSRRFRLVFDALHDALTLRHRLQPA